MGSRGCSFNARLKIEAACSGSLRSSACHASGATASRGGRAPRRVATSSPEKAARNAASSNPQVERGIAMGGPRGKTYTGFPEERKPRFPLEYEKPDAMDPIRQHSDL